MYEFDQIKRILYLQTLYTYLNTRKGSKLFQREDPFMNINYVHWYSPFGVQQQAMLTYVKYF